MKNFILGDHKKNKAPNKGIIQSKQPVHSFTEKPKNLIEWTGPKRYNTVTGCKKVSQGCKFCYAERVAKRAKAEGSKKYRNGFKITIHPYVITAPRKWKKPQIVFVNSMSDLFHDEIPEEHIKEVFKEMNNHPQHQFQILTKRSERLKKLAPKLNWTPNIWMGVSVEDDRVLHRVDDLKATPAHIKFISAEPLIGSLKGIDLSGIDWCIIGGESGPPKVRPMKLGWIEEIMEECDRNGTKVFMKQMGRHLGKKLGMGKNGNVDYHGKDSSKFPEFMQRWEFPIDIRDYLHCFDLS
jgi:protein gp37